MSGKGSFSKLDVSSLYASLRPNTYTSSNASRFGVASAAGSAAKTPVKLQYPPIPRARQ